MTSKSHDWTWSKTLVKDSTSCAYNSMDFKTSMGASVHMPWMYEEDHKLTSL